MIQYRAEGGYLLPKDDPRVKVAEKAIQPIVGGAKRGIPWDWRDAAEVVNAVLDEEDKVRARFTHAVANNEPTWVVKMRRQVHR